MKLHRVAWATVLAFSLCAAAHAADDSASIDAVLGQLHDVGVGLHSFTADVTLTVTDNSGMGNAYSHSGRAIYQLKPAGDARIRVVFDKGVQNGETNGDKLEYLLDNGWLTDRNYHTKHEAAHQVAQPGQKIDLFKLGDGPFPLPIGQDPHDVHALFDVQLLPQPPDGQSHLLLTPKADTPYAKKFQSIEVYVDGQTHMPARIDTVDADGGNTRETLLSNVKVNPTVADADFSLPALEGQWSSVREPLKTN